MSKTSKAPRKSGKPRDTKPKVDGAVHLTNDRPPISVLAIDNDPGFLLVLAHHLDGADPQRFTFHEACGSEEARSLLEWDDGIEVILLDHRLGGTEDGLGLLKCLRADGDDRPIIMMTAYGEECLATEMAKHGADGCLIKSDIDGPRLLLTIDQVRKRWRQHQPFRAERRTIRQRAQRHSA